MTLAGTAGHCRDNIKSSHASSYCLLYCTAVLQSEHVAEPNRLYKHQHVFSEKYVNLNYNFLVSDCNGNLDNGSSNESVGL